VSGRGFFRPRLVSGARGQRARDDRADQFRLIMLPHMDAAYGFARYLTRDGTAAEDIVQEAFVRAFRAFHGWRGDSPKSWLLAIVRNCFLDSVATNRDPLRGAVTTGEFDNHIADLTMTGARNPEDIMTERAEAAMLRQTIENLPEPFREALVLRELEEFSYKEIAAITQIPIGTVMSRLARARDMLTTLLRAPVGRSSQVQS
jgi:RNA polymerase sigma factor (sigma-70 family)